MNKTKTKGKVSMEQKQNKPGAPISKPGTPATNTATATPEKKTITPVLISETDEIKITKESLSREEPEIFVAIKQFKSLGSVVKFLGEAKTLDMLNQRFDALIRARVKATILPDPKAKDYAEQVKALAAKDSMGLVFSAKDAEAYRPGQREGGDFNARLTALLKQASDASATPEQRTSALAEAQKMILEKQAKAIEAKSKALEAKKAKA